MTILEISQSLKVERHRIDNIVKARKLLVKRIRCSPKEMDRRIAFIRANLHLTKRELSEALNVSNHVIRNICRVHGIRTARKLATPAQQRERVAFMKLHPEFTKKQFADALGLSMSTVYRMLWASGLPFRSVYKSRTKVIVLNAPRRLPKKNSMNRFLMGN